MKRYKVYPEITSYYYSTLSITAWLPVFQDVFYFRIIINSLQYCRENKGLFLIGYVIMPTHLHLITSNEDNTTLPEILRDFKNFTSKKISQQLEIDGRNTFLKVFERSAEKLKKQKLRVWQHDYHPIALTSEEWMNQKMDYVHDNPVRKGFVETPENWKYSSARNWYENDDSIIEIDRHCLG